MASDDAVKTSRSGLSLYANLLGSKTAESAPGTISSAPVVYKQSQSDELQQDSLATEKSQISSAALRFQPTKRPQVSAQKPKAKLPAQRVSVTQSASGNSEANAETSRAAARAPAKTTLADWTAEGDEDDVNGFYAVEKRQRGGRKKRKKNKEEAHVAQNWDDIYDPSRPNVYEDYKNSDEKFVETREWKDRLYAHRRVQRHSSDYSSDSEAADARMPKRFAPPTQLSFAPPPTFEQFPLPPPPEIVQPSGDATGEDVYLRRMQFSQRADEPPSRAQQPRPSFVPPLAASISTSSRNTPATSTAPSEPSISKAPVRYNLPPPPPDIPASEAELQNAIDEEDQAPEISQAEEDTPRSLRPGQKGFAERLMSKYGWSKGSGLGVSGAGITAPLRVQLEKQKKKPDSEGGGFVGPGGMGKIIGGKKKDGADAAQEGKFGTMSDVIVLRGMLDSMDVDEEIARGDGGLMQEIGDECGEKYGRVERVFINRNNSVQASVFVKFTSQLSALRAVNALESRIFNGNTITARFFDTGRFEAGIYE